MHSLSMLLGWSEHVPVPRQKWMLAALLAALLLVWPLDSHGQSADASSDSLMVMAEEQIAYLEFELAVRDSQLVAQREYYITLLDLKDNRIAVLEKIIDDLKGTTVGRFLDRLLWGAAGYGIGRATE